MRRLYGLLAGALIGALVGLFADQVLTSLVLQHSDQMFVVVITNAVSAFLVIPLFVILFSYLGYRMINKRRSNGLGG